MQYKRIVLPIMISMVALFGIWVWVEQASGCCIHSSGRGPFGQNSYLVGQVYLQTVPDVPVEGAIVSIQYEDAPSLIGCTYSGDSANSDCHTGVEHGQHYSEWGAYYGINVGRLVPLNEEGLLVEPVDLQITAVYTLDNQQYEASGIYTLNPNHMDAYGNQRVDITLSLPTNGGVIDGADVPYLTLINATENGQGGVTLIPDVGGMSSSNALVYAESIYSPFTQTLVLTGTYNVNDVITFNQTIDAPAQHMYPLSVYDEDGLLLGVGANDFSLSREATLIFGDGRDGIMPTNGNLDNNNGFGVGTVNGASNSTDISVVDRQSVSRINAGDVVLIHQTRGVGAGNWEINKAVSNFTGSGTFILENPLRYTYSTSDPNNRAQIIRVPQYSICNVTNTVTPLAPWNGTWGGIFTVMCNGEMNVSGSITADAWGYRGGLGDRDDWAWTGEGDLSPSIRRNIQNPSGNGGGANHVSCAGGGHGTLGISGGEGTVGDEAGTPDLNTMVMGGGGGGAGVNVNPGDGGNGGGIIVLLVRSLSLTGSISVNGGAGQSVPSDGRSGCGGAGGAIFIRSENVTIDSNTLTATGGPKGSGGTYSHSGAGGDGRIHIEYCETLSGVTNPSANVGQLDCDITSNIATSNFGINADGDLLAESVGVNSATNANLINVGDGSFGDYTCSSGTCYMNGVREPLLVSVNAGDRIIEVNTSGDYMEAGYEVLLIQMRGTNVGAYEFAMIEADLNGSLRLTEQLQNDYFVDSNSKAQVIPVPHWHNITVGSDAILRPYAWDGNVGGVLVFRASGTVIVESGGEINAEGSGYRIQTWIRNGGGVIQYPGEGYYQDGTIATTAANYSGGGGGRNETGNDAYDAKGAGGGGHATLGVSSYGAGGGIIGQPDLSQEIHFGGAGGHGGHHWRRETGHMPSKGNGGGIILFFASDFMLAGSINVNGEDGKSHNDFGESQEGGIGGGAGGSVYIAVNDYTNTGTIEALGGAGGIGRDQNGGAGGDGRIHISSCNNISGSTTPEAYIEQNNCSAIIWRLDGNPNTELQIPTEVNGTATYHIQYGQHQYYPLAGTHTYSFTLPRENYTDMTFDLLVENLQTSSLNISVDIGADGSIEWTPNATQSGSLLSSPNLEAGLNAYLDTLTNMQGESTLIPVNISLNGEADLLLTNVETVPDDVSPPVTGIATTTHIALPQLASWSQAVITADLTLPDTATFTIFDTEGQELESFVLQNGHNQLDLSTLPPADLQLQFTLEGIETPAITSWELQWQSEQQLSYRVGGQVLDGFRKPLKKANVQFLQGTSVIAETQTDAYGFYTSPILDVIDNLYVRVLLRHGTSTDYTFQVRYGANNMLNGSIIYRQTAPFDLLIGSPFTTYMAHVDFNPHHNQFNTNLPDLDKLDDVTAIYHHTEQVMHFVQTELNVTTLSPFDVSTYAGNVTYYDEEHELIVLGADYSDYKNANRPMNREWHETFHHIMATTIGMPQSDCDGGSQNHGGYDNCSTSDSYAEGFAEYWATVLGANINYQPRPDLYYIGIGKNGKAGIPLEYNWKAWEQSCYFCPSREEFAVASLLWDLSDPIKEYEQDYIQLDIETVWQLLAYNHIDNMFDLYQVLQGAGVGQSINNNSRCDLNDLDVLFVEHGFFYDADDDKRYDCGEVVGRAADMGRPGRRAAPTTNTLIDIQSNVYPITVTVAYEYPNMPEMNFQYEVALETGYLYIEPTSTDDLVNITISGYTTNTVATQPMQFTNHEYWAWVDSYGPGVVQAHSLGMSEGLAVPLEAGWNKIALPIDVANNNLETIFTDPVSFVYTYDGCDANDPWKSYDPAPPPFAPPNDLTSINPSLGYWVYADMPTTLMVTGTHTIAPSQTLCAGWNLISSPVMDVTLIEDATQPISNVLELVYEYDVIDAGDPWKRFDPNPSPFAPPNDLVLMAPYKAYWVQVAEATVWDVR